MPTSTISELAHEVITSAGMDWLTYVATGKEQSRLLYSEAIRLMEMCEPEPNLWQDFARYGYKGHRVDGLSVGFRDDNSTMVICSGEFSVAGLSLVRGLQGRCTRLDLQVTFHVKQPDYSLAFRTYEALEKINAERQRPRYLKYIKSATGETLYVGKRNGRVVLRLYDKTDSISPGELGRYWRYEVEYKKEAAERAIAVIAETKSIQEAAIGLVSAEFSKRDVKPRFKTQSTISAIAVKLAASTAETKLSWLAKCVAPVVSQLCLAGYDEQVIQALRLRDIIVRWRDK